MKTKIFWIIGAIVLALVIIGLVFIAQPSHKPPIKPFTFENMSYQVSPCNQEDNEVFANITINSDSVTLHQKASYVCCANITLRYEINGTTLNIYEDNKGEICRCICNYEIYATIKVKNITEVNVYGIYYPEVHPYELLGEYPAKNKTCAKEGEQFSKVYKNEYPEICCSGLTEWDSGFDTRKVVNGTCVETGLLAGSPVGTCIKCGDGVCGSNETICNCPEDCNITNNSCIKEGEDKGPMNNCCSGLNSTAVYNDLDCSGIGIDISVCTKCGNHLCGLGESHCNCPQDCAPGCSFDSYTNSTVCSVD